LHSKTLKLLIVEDSLEDEQLLCEALLEIEQNRLWTNWRSANITPVDRLADALTCLSRETFDAILLNLSLPDSAALLDSFLDVSNHAGSTPILVLADEPDDNLANRLLREGAQDVILKSELDCVPLARAVRYAIERGRRAEATRVSALTDRITGLLSREVFLSAAARYARLPVPLLAAAIEIQCDDPKARDLLLIRTAEMLSAAFPAPSLIGRWDRCRFSLITIGLTENSVEAKLPETAIFSVAPVYSAEGLEEFFNAEILSAEICSADPHLHAKTAILAD
jgi:CheY-like chemotaxis protein